MEIMIMIRELCQGPDLVLGVGIFSTGLHDTNASWSSCVRVCLNVHVHACEHMRSDTKGWVLFKQ